MAIDPQWQSELGTGGKGSRRLLSLATPQVAHMTLQMYAESYSVAADLLAGLGTESAPSSTEFVDRCMNYGKQALLQRRISSEASTLKLLFNNALKSFAARNLTDASQPNFESLRREQADALDRLIHRVEVSRALAISSRGRPTIRDGARGGL